MASEDQTLFVWYVICTLGKGLLKDLLMIFTVHIGHQFLYLLILQLEGLITENANSARVALGDIAELIWLPRYHYTWCPVEAYL